MAFKPLPVKTTYIASIGIPTSPADSPAGRPQPTHGGGGSGGGGADGTTFDWESLRPDVQVCAGNVYNC